MGFFYAWPSNRYASVWRFLHFLGKHYYVQDHNAPAVAEAGALKRACAEREDG